MLACEAARFSNSQSAVGTLCAYTAAERARKARMLLTYVSLERSDTSRSGAGAQKTFWY